MKQVRDMTEAELAAFVSQHLRERGIEVVLSGGMCVTIYAERKYVSGDLDLVMETGFKTRKYESALAEIGFVRTGRTFKHQDSTLLVDIRPPPLSVGQEPVGKVVERKLDTGTLRILSSTDCVKDRLAGYYYHKDNQCLEQARLVVQHNADVDLSEVARWSEAEGEALAFAAIRDKLLRHKPIDK